MLRLGRAESLHVAEDRMNLLVEEGRSRREHHHIAELVGGSRTADRILATDSEMDSQTGERSSWVDIGCRGRT